MRKLRLIRVLELFTALLASASSVDRGKLTTEASGWSGKNATQQIRAEFEFEARTSKTNSSLQDDHQGNVLSVLTEQSSTSSFELEQF